MGGKTATTTQSVKIPEEVMARYNAVNARAEEVAKQPFQQYQGQFVAPLTQTQQAGIAGTSAASGMAQPYYQGATQQLLGAQQAATPMYYNALQTAGGAAEQAQNIYGSALGGIGQAARAGQAITNAAMQPIAGAQQTSAPLMGAATGLTSAGLAAAQPYMGAAGGYLAGGTQGVSPAALTGQEIGQYMSPYMSNVIGAQQALQAQENAAQRAALSSQQIGRGSFGGERAGLGQANLARQQSLANQATLANLLQSGYGQALSTAQQQQAQQLAAEQANRAAMQFGVQAAGNLGQQAFGQNLAAAQQFGNLGQQAFGQNIAQGQALAGLGQQQYGMGLGAAQAAAGIGQNVYGMGAQQAALQQGVGQGLYGMGAQTAQSLAGLGAGAQQAALQGAQAQIGAGTLEQQTQQADATARYQQFLQERGYPFQVAQFLANIAMGTGALSGSTTTTQQPAPFFSDERLKNDIEPVGELYDGQKVYRYDMGDGRKQIGLIAQEVEGVRPDAVGEARGFKTVDYGRATDDAAGLGAAASMGGAVTEPGAYAAGGLVDGDDLKAILAAQAQSFGPFGGAGMYGGNAQSAPFGGVKGFVPEAKLPVAKLATAGNAPAQRQSGLSEAAQTGKTIADLGKMAKTGLVGSAGTKDDPKGEAGLFGAGGKFSSEDNIFTRGKEFLGFAYGGLVPRGGYATAGSVNPYEKTEDPLQNVLEEQSKNDIEPIKPGQMPPPPKSAMSEIADFAKMAASIYAMSDARLKSNIEPVGETYDGQQIYRYDFGDGRTQIGLMAQEVMRKHPEAVGERNGYLTLDYDKATGEAVPFAYGGLVPRQGYATEGAVEDEAEKPSFDIEKAKSAIAGIESGGRYEALGPVTGRGDRAYGKYQVMGANIPSWTEEALGRRMTPEEFSKSPEAQEKVFEHHFGKAVQKYGNPYDAASVWFSGRPMARAGNASDILGTTVPAYVSKFRASYEGDAPRPPGLIPEKQAAGVEYVKGSEAPSMFDKLSEKATSRDFLVPALSFVGSMLSSKSPYLAGAIGEGIVGGVQGYQSNLKQQADLAKVVLDIVKDRFVVRTDPNTGQTIYMNKSTGQPLTPAQFNSAVTGIAKGIGVAPSILGLDAGSAPGAPAAIGAIPAIGAQQPAGQAAGQAAPAAAEPKKPGEPASQEPKKPVNKFAMSLNELKTYAESNPEEFGLVGERDPAKLRAEIEQYTKAMKNAETLGNESEAQRYMALAEKRREIMNQNIADAVDKQYKDNLEIQKASTQRGQDYLKEAMSRVDQYEVNRAGLVRLADIYSRYQSGRLEGIKADLADVARQLRIPLPESFNTASYDEAMKIALTQAFQSIEANNLSRAPKASLTATVQTVPAPNLASGAAYALIGKELGRMDYYHARDKDYIENGAGQPPEKFLMGYDKRTGNNVSKFISKAYSEIPVSKGAGQTVEDLRRTYDFTPRLRDEKGNLPTQQQATPEVPAIPPADQRETGKVYTVPGKGEYRWMGTGWQKVEQ